MSIAIPDTAKIVLLQEEKFKSHRNELSYILREHSRVLGSVAPIARALLRPHAADLELRLRPGMTTITWTSMNIDSYKASVTTGLTRFEELVMTVNGIIENRIEKNLKVVGRAELVVRMSISWGLVVRSRLQSPLH